MTLSREATIIGILFKVDSISFLFAAAFKEEVVYELGLIPCVCEDCSLL